ncbi:unnamed protein product [Amoebophrya sp. A25]|nr:unnamed protein product [Amoebophrya sp. A25]|eukprot:GSA25T00022617001.1
MRVTTLNPRWPDSGVFYDGGHLPILRNPRWESTEAHFNFCRLIGVHVVEHCYADQRNSKFTALMPLTADFKSFKKRLEGLIRMHRTLTTDPEWCMALKDVFPETAHLHGLVRHVPRYEWNRFDTGTRSSVDYLQRGLFEKPAAAGDEEYRQYRDGVDGWGGKFARYIFSKYDEMKMDLHEAADTNADTEELASEPVVVWGVRGFAPDVRATRGHRQAFDFDAGWAQTGRKCTSQAKLKGEAPKRTAGTDPLARRKLDSEDTWKEFASVGPQFLSRHFAQVAEAYGGHEAVARICFIDGLQEVRDPLNTVIAASEREENCSLKQDLIRMLAPPEEDDRQEAWHYLRRGVESSPYHATKELWRVYKNANDVSHPYVNVKYCLASQFEQYVSCASFHAAKAGTEASKFGSLAVSDKERTVVQPKYLWRWDGRSEDGYGAWMLNVTRVCAAPICASKAEGVCAPDVDDLEMFPPLGLKVIK